MHFGFGGIGMILFWVVIIAAIVIAVRAATGWAAGRGGETRTPMETLKDRYAAGEITTDEFEERKRKLAER